MSRCENCGWCRSTPETFLCECPDLPAVEEVEPDDGRDCLHHYYAHDDYRDGLVDVD